MSKLRWRYVWGLGALGVVLLVSLAVASATGVRSTVTIVSGKGTQFAGKVSSAKRKCRANRTVKLYTEPEGERAGDQLVGTAKTDASGYWRMDGSFLAGVYYAQVLALVVQIEGMAYRCGSDLSLRAHY